MDFPQEISKFIDNDKELTLRFKEWISAKLQYETEQYRQRILSIKTSYDSDASNKKKQNFRDEKF